MGPRWHSGKIVLLTSDVSPGARRYVTVPASHVTADFDWWAIAERLAAIVGEPLVEGQFSASLH